MHKSLATINSPEFINLTPLDINPLMSKCEIKVLYLGENRNHTFITKEVATDMAKTLRGAPIVGYWKQEKEDFRDHGEVIIIDEEGITFECKTIPYGFVAPDAQVWFQEFEDTNDFGETTVREYLMTTGYLWTGQFEECKSAVESDGKPQSMELDKNTVNGHWEVNKRGMDFFIINDAIFSKLCILGDDIEPCFEGAKVSAPDVSASFTKVDDTFKQTLFTMMQDLQTALRGGQQMNNDVVENVVVEEPAVEPVTEPAVEPEIPTDNSFAASQEPIVEPEAPATNPEVETEFKKDEDEDKDPEAEPAQNEDDKKEEEDDEDKKKYTALAEAHELLQSAYSTLEDNFNDLQSRFKALEAAHAELVEFKRQSDDAKKDEMIGKFYMLSDDDKADVIINKANYSVEEIEEKLSVICFRKKVNFDLENNSNNHNNVDITTYNLNSVGNEDANKPAWLSAVDNYKKNI